MKIRTILATTLGTLLVLALAGQAQAAAQAGRVTFAFGDATIEGTDGATRDARRGATLYSGDTITTGDRGRVQMRFTDGGFVSLTSDTSFKIDEYQFDGEGEAEEKGFFSLIKGGMRALTGLVGKQDRDAYRLSTVVATIGIRGTHYRATFNPITLKFLASVGFDPSDPTAGIRVTAGGRTVAVDPGGSVVVEGEGAPPRPTTEQAQVAAVQPDGGGGTDPGDEGKDFDQSGLLAGTDESGVPAPPQELFGILFGLDYVAAAVGPDPDAFQPMTDISPFGSLDIEESAFEIFFTSGNAITGALFDDEFGIGLDLIDVNIAEGLKSVVEQLASGFAGFTTNADFEQALNTFLTMPATNLDLGSDSATGLNWGRWGGGYVLLIDIEENTATGNLDLFATAAELQGHQSLHWIYGPRATTLPISGVATYGFVSGAATSSTTLDGSGIGNGMTGGQLRVDFHNLFVVGENLVVNHSSDITFNTSGSLIKDPTGGGAGFLTSGSGAGAPCGQGCSAYLNGYLTDLGGNAVPNGAAAAYKLAPNYGDGSGGDTIMGVGGFQRSAYDSQAIIGF